MAWFFRLRNNSTQHGYQPPIAYNTAAFKMLLVGETGSGKTSLINLLCNCAAIQEIGYEKMEISSIRQFTDFTLEDPNAKKMESKTSGAKIYPTKIGKLDIAVIDTPGFGDTRGFCQDKDNTQKIIQILQETDHINCVCLVINGRQPRLNPAVKYVFTQITTILPQEIENNLIVIFTNTNDELELTFDVAELNKYFQNKISTEQIYYIENPCCKLERAKSKLNEHQSISDDAARNMVRSFQATAEVFNKMEENITKYKPVHTKQFLLLYEKKQQIETKLLNIFVRYDELRELDKRIKQDEEKVAAALRTKQLNSNYETTQTFTRHIINDTEKHNTLCKAPHCYSNCHIECRLDKSLDTETFRKCSCMKQMEYCTKCGHHYTYHYHGEKLHDTELCVEHKIDPTMKQKFETAKTQEERSSMLKEENERRRMRSEKQKESLSKELLVILDEFHGMAMSRNYAKLLKTQIELIELRLEDADTTETASLRETKNELASKLEVVQKTLEVQPWSTTEPAMTKEWACSCLKIHQQNPLKRKQVEQAYKEVSKTSHPDKGGDDAYFQRVKRARDYLYTITQ